MQSASDLADDRRGPDQRGATPPAAQPTGYSLRGFLKVGVKVLITVAAFYLLFTHRVRTESGESVTALQAILNYLPQIHGGVFWRFTLLAVLIKSIGIFASMVRWYLLLRGQGIIFPFGHIVTTFLIGRFLGTFLPSTIGLDGYKLYDAARYSGRTVEAAAATGIEKCLGMIGIFVSFLVSFPLGYTILGARAAVIAAITVPLSFVVIGVFFVIAFEPGITTFVLRRLPIQRLGRVATLLERLATAATAYSGQKLLLLQATVLSFVVHFTTAVLYYCTALAIGAEHAQFWEVTFASTIQIFATVMSPFTIAGEGVREIVQTLLLAHKIGASQSIISAALGFWAAEALTLSGGIFYFLRTADYRPRVELVPRGTAA